MFNLSKIFNKKVLSKLLGKQAPYSVSFINCQMDWYEIPMLKKLAKKNYPTLDNLVGIPASYETTKTDVILRIFVNPASDIEKSWLRKKGVFKFKKYKRITSADSLEYLNSREAHSKYLKPIIFLSENQKIKL